MTEDRRRNAWRRSFAQKGYRSNLLEAELQRSPLAASRKLLLGKFGYFSDKAEGT